MENRKEAIDKELKLEKEKLELEIERLKREKEKYGFDYDAMEKTLKNIKYITLSNVAVASLLNVINPLIGTISYPLFAGVTSNLGEILLEKHYIKENKLGIFSSKEKMASNYEKILNIDLKIEEASLKNRIVDRAIDINKTDYRIINNNQLKNNNNDLNQIALQNTIVNDNFLHGEEINYSGKTFIKSSLLDGIGGGVIFLTFMPSVMAFGLGTMAATFGTVLPHVRSLSIVRESNDMLFKHVNVIEECKNVKKDFINENKDEKNKTISEEELLNIIEKEAYKKVNDYNNNLESISRKRKINEYYKMKESIMDYIDYKEQKEIEEQKNNNKPKKHIFRRRQPIITGGTRIH